MYESISVFGYFSSSQFYGVSNTKTDLFIFTSFVNFLCDLNKHIALIYVQALCLLLFHKDAAWNQNEASVEEGREILEADHAKQYLNVRQIEGPVADEGALPGDISELLGF